MARILFILIFVQYVLTKKWGLRGRKASPFRAEMDSPLIEGFKYLFAKNPLVTLMTLLPSSTEGLMGLREEYQSSLLPFKGLELSDESPLCGGYPHTLNAKWEWFSEPLDCPPNERCNPESMVGALALQGGEEVSWTSILAKRKTSLTPSRARGKGSRVYYRLNIFFNFNVNS